MMAKNIIFFMLLGFEAGIFGRTTGIVRVSDAKVAKDILACKGKSCSLAILNLNITGLNVCLPCIPAHVNLPNYCIHF